MGRGVVAGCGSLVKVARGGGGGGSRSGVDGLSARRGEKTQRSMRGSVVVAKGGGDTVEGRRSKTVVTGMVELVQLTHPMGGL